jgi:hypothetical protein
VLVGDSVMVDVGVLDDGGEGVGVGDINAVGVAVG